jgi:hypothetical protein
MVWVGMSRGRFVGGRNVKAPVKGRSLSVVSAGAANTAFVEAAKELPAQGMQKPPRGVGEKPFPDGFLAAPATIVKKPAGLRTRPAGRQLDRLDSRRGHRAWARQSAAPSGAARHGVHGCARLDAAHGDDLLLLPDLEGDGVGFRRRTVWGPS